MKSLPIFLFMLTFVILFNTQDVQAQFEQCWACYSTFDEDGNPTCNTELVDRDGSAGCGCDTGCSCSGSCTLPEEAFLPEIDLEDIDVPSNGYRIKIESENSERILAEFENGGQIGDQKTELVWFGRNVALYELSDHEFLIYPIRENEFDLKGCDGEIMATIKKI